MWVLATEDCVYRTLEMHLYCDQSHVSACTVRSIRAVPALCSVVTSAETQGWNSCPSLCFGQSLRVSSGCLAWSMGHTDLGDITCALEGLAPEYVLSDVHLSALTVLLFGMDSKMILSPRA